MGVAPTLANFSGVHAGVRRTGEGGEDDGIKVAFTLQYRDLCFTSDRSDASRVNIFENRSSTFVLEIFAPHICQDDAPIKIVHHTRVCMFKNGCVLKYFAFFSHEKKYMYMAEKNLFTDLYTIELRDRLKAAYIEM